MCCLPFLEKRLNLNFGQTDIYVKVGGGMRLQDPGMDLALVAAVLSSFYDLALPEKAVVWGEVDLNGQIRAVHAHDSRLTQAKGLATALFCGPAIQRPTMTNFQRYALCKKCPVFTYWCK